MTTPSGAKLYEHLAFGTDPWATLQPAKAGDSVWIEASRDGVNVDGSYGLRTATADAASLGTTVGHPGTYFRACASTGTPKVTTCTEF